MTRVMDFTRFNNIFFFNYIITKYKDQIKINQTLSDKIEKQKAIKNPTKTQFELWNWKEKEEEENKKSHVRRADLSRRGVWGG